MHLICGKCRSLNEWHSKKAESMTEHIFDGEARGKLTLKLPRSAAPQCTTQVDSHTEQGLSVAHGNRLCGSVCMRACYLYRKVACCSLSREHDTV